MSKRSFVRYSTYRAATIAGCITNTFFGFVKAAIMLAVYRQRTMVGNFDAVDAVTFTFVSQGFIAALGAFGGHLPLADRIQSGDVVADLYRPVDLQAFELASDAGRAGFQLLVRATVPIAAGALVFHLRLPVDPAVWVAFAVSIVIALVVSFALRFLVSLSTFWFLDYRAPSQMSTVITMFFSGFLIPVVFFPAWLESLARMLPFVATVQLPIEILLGKRSSASGLLSAYGAQLFWAAVLIGVGRYVLARATRRVVVQGG